MIGCSVLGRGSHHAVTPNLLSHPATGTFSPSLPSFFYQIFFLPVLFLSFFFLLLHNWCFYRYFIFCTVLPWKNMIRTINARFKGNILLNFFTFFYIPLSSLLISCTFSTSSSSSFLLFTFFPPSFPSCSYHLSITTTTTFITTITTTSSSLHLASKPHYTCWR